MCGIDFRWARTEAPGLDPDAPFRAADPDGEGPGPAAADRQAATPSPPLAPEAPPVVSTGP